jgi:outer membrane cobalamin receptor
MKKSFFIIAISAMGLSLSAQDSSDVFHDLKGVEVVASRFQHKAGESPEIMQIITRQK